MYECDSYQNSPAAYENERLSLLGDSFSIFAFIIPAAALCQKFLPRLSYSHLCDLTGLGPGFHVPWRVKALVARKLQYGFAVPESLVYPLQLNKILLSRLNHTGSDVRITAGEILNPKAFPGQAVEAGNGGMSSNSSGPTRSTLTGWNSGPFIKQSCMPFPTVRSRMCDFFT